MRILLALGLSICLLLSGCEVFTPDTSRALSQTRQIEELHHQTELMERQAKALERLANSYETSQSSPAEATETGPANSESDYDRT